MRSRSDFFSVISCIAGTSLVLGTHSSFTLWALPWASEFDVPRRSVMLIYSATSVLGILLVPFVGRLIGRFAPWKLMMIGTICMGAGLMACGLATSFPMLALVYSFAIAAGILLCGPVVSQSLAVRGFPDHAGTIAGMTMVGWAIGSSVIPLVVAPLLASYGWRVAIPAIGAVVLIAVPTICLTLLRSGPLASKRSAIANNDQAKRLISTRKLLSTRNFWIILCTLLPMDFVQVGVAQNLIPFLVDRGLDPLSAGYVLSAKAVGVGLGALVAGHLVDRRDPRQVWIFASLLSLTSLIVLALEPSLVIAGIALVMVGFAAGAIMPLIASFLVRAFGPTGYPAAYGLYALFALPAGLGPFASGWVRDVSGTYTATFIVGAAMVSVGMLAARQFRTVAESALEACATPHLAAQR